MTSFDFTTTDPWEVSTDTILPAGNYVCKITEAEDDTSSGGYPQINLRVEDEEGNGAIRDWLTITEASFGKVVALAQAAGVSPTETEQKHFQDKGGRAPKTWLNKLVGKSVGVVVRDEPDYKDATKMRQRVQGYVAPERVSGRTGPAASSDVTPANAAAAPVSTDDEALPF